MRVGLDAGGLRHELARRGMTGAELAAIAGLSEATVSHAMTGRPVSYVTLRKLARGLTVTPALPGIDAIIGRRFVGSEGNGAAGFSPATAVMEAKPSADSGA